MWDIDKILKELHKKFPCSAYVPDELDVYFWGINFDKDELKVLNNSPTALGLEGDGLVSSEQLDDFAKALNFFSPMGYDYVRESLKLNLPHPRLVHKMFVQRNGSPGYMEEMLDLIKQKTAKSEKPPLCALTMVLKTLDRYEKAAFGSAVDFGGWDCDDEPKEVLIFFINFLEESLHIPFGYFIVPYMNSVQVKNMINGAMEVTHEAGVKVISLTTEPNNQVLAESLGCSIKFDRLKSTFDHPVTKEPVVLFVNINECMGSIRLALQADSPIKVSSSNNKIDWSQVERSVNLLGIKNETALHSDLIKAHINLRGKKKATIACEKMSNNLAEFGRAMSLKLSKENACDLQPTIEYIETFNKVYDILSTRALTKPSNDKEKDFKSPMKLENGGTILQFFKKVENYMNSLKSNAGKNLVEKTGFLGLLTCMHSASFLYNSLVLTGNINMLPMQTFSLDHIYQLINIIRAKNHQKPNRDPISRHYKDYFKTLIKQLQGKKSFDQKLIQLKKEFMLKNVSAIQTINTTSCRASLVDREKVVEAKVTKEQDKTFKLVFSATQQVLDFTNPITTYVAGYVASYLYNVIDCEVCNDALVTTDPKTKRASIRFKDDFGFVNPSEDVKRICVITEDNIKEALITWPRELLDKDIFKPLIVNQTLTRISGCVTDIFDSFAYHQFDQGPNENHLILLMKAVTEEYVNVRYRYLPVTKSLAGNLQDLQKLSFFKTGKQKDKRLRLW